MKFIQSAGSKKYFRHVVLLLVWLAGTTACPLMAQQPEPQTQPFQSAVELGSSLSYVGFKLHLAYLLKYRRHELYVGPHLVISNSYLPSRGPLGLQAGYRFNWLQKGRLKAFANLDYQAAFWRPYDPQKLGDGGLNRVHEFHAGYGILFRLADHWWVGNHLGLGGYLEEYIDVRESETNHFSGFSSLIRAFVSYGF